MKRSILTILALTVVTLSLSGCKKEDPEPELLDPIYQDLLKRSSDAQKAYEDEVKKQADVKAKLDKDEPNSIDVKDDRKELAKSEHLSIDLEQKARYFKIRAERRKFVDRISYHEAFVKNEKWPDPREYSDYQVNIRLQEAPLNWNIRVPKLQDRLSKTSPKAEKQASKGEE